MGIKNDVGGGEGNDGAALAFKGLNDVVVLAFQKQGSLSHT